MPTACFDPARDFLILTELFGNGRSSSPSNTPEPFHGPRFPVTTIRDNVEIVHRLLTQELQVNHLRAVVGFSMGAEQAFQWAVSHPDFMDAIVATSGTAKCYGHGFVRLEGQIAALTTDPAWQGGDYAAPPTKGLEAFSMVWAGWLYSQEWWRQELWRTNSPAGHDVRAVREQAFRELVQAPMRTTTFFRRGRGSATTSARPRALMAMSSGRCDRSKCASSTCRPKRICIFR